jgi:hypothetical protein
MSGFRWNIEAFASPARRGRVGGGSVPLVRVRLFDGPGVVDTLTGGPAGEPEAFTDLDSREARDLASCLLAAAEHADILSRADWKTER